MAEIRPDERSGVLHPANLERFAARWLDPSPVVSVLVERYWSTRWSLPAGEVVPQTILTFPALTLTIEDGEAPARFVLTGVHRGPWHRDIAGRGEVFALRLRPAGVMLLGAVSVASVADATVPATDPLTLGLLRTIAEGTTNEQRVALADRALTAMLDTGPDSELLLANAALDLLSEGVRSRTVPDLARELGVSARTVQRALHRTLGQGPRWVARWVRLQEVARLISVDDVPDLAQIAATLGYVDQAHLTRDFRAAAGTTPGAYARSLRRLAGG